MLSSLPKLTLWLAVSIIIGSLSVAAQSSGGRLTGRTVDKDGKPVAGVLISVTNQASTEALVRRSRADGSFSIRLRPGAYRITIDPPYEARFDRGKTADYGVFSNLICDETKKRCTTLENVIIDTTERKFEIVVVDPTKEMAEADKGKPAKPVVIDRREVRDRWRYEFPEYDRYGDKGARGRDIPFKRGSWYNPYDRNVLKGDFPIIGNDYFMILSGVSTTGVELRRTPTNTAISSARANENNPFGHPESFSFNETIQLSFELFKGQTVSRHVQHSELSQRPREWHCKHRCPPRH